MHVVALPVLPLKSCYCSSTMDGPFHGVIMESEKIPCKPNRRFIACHIAGLSRVIGTAGVRMSPLDWQQS